VNGKKRGVGTDTEFAILTAEISKATFGLTPSEHKKFKGLKKENLRDHMNDLELIFTMLGEASTTKIARGRNAQGFVENEKDCDCCQPNSNGNTDITADGHAVFTDTARECKEQHDDKRDQNDIEPWYQVHNLP
jgi:hypothetical protein